MQMNKIKKYMPYIMDSVTQANVAGSAAEMCYYLLLALFPVLLMVANIIPLLPLDQDMVISLFQDLLPDQIETLIVPTLESYLSSSNPGVISVGFILSIWSASVAFNTLQNVLNRVYDIGKPNNFLVTRVLSFLMALLMVIGMGVVSLAFVFGQTILNVINSFVPLPSNVFDLFISLRWPVLIVVLFLVLIYVYQVIPKHHYPLKFSLPGALLAALLLMVLNTFFTLYVEYFGGSSVSNGTLGVFIVLMLYLYLSSIVVIVGALVNQIIYKLNHIEYFADKPQKPLYIKSEDYHVLYDQTVVNGEYTNGATSKEE